MAVEEKLVLLVEDFPPLIQSIIKMLEPAGFTVTTASDFAAAVEILERRTPELVCLDLGLPRESGYELCEYIRSKPTLNSTLILVMNETRSPAEMAHAEEVGANGFIRKPFTREQLLKYVRTMISGPRSSTPSMPRLRLSDPPPLPGSNTPVKS